MTYVVDTNWGFRSTKKHKQRTEVPSLGIVNDIPGSNLSIRLEVLAAFDTIDHTILYKRLDHNFGICGYTLDWFTPYLIDKSHRIKHYQI